MPRVSDDYLLNTWDKLIWDGPDDKDDVPTLVCRDLLDLREAVRELFDAIREYPGGFQGTLENGYSPSAQKIIDARARLEALVKEAPDVRTT